MLAVRVDGQRSLKRCHICTFYCKFDLMTAFPSIKVETNLHDVQRYSELLVRGVIFCFENLQVNDIMFFFYSFDKVISCSADKC